MINNNNGTITDIQLNTVMKSIGTMYQGIVCDADGTMFIGSNDKVNVNSRSLEERIGILIANNENEIIAIEHHK